MAVKKAVKKAAKTARPAAKKAVKQPAKKAPAVAKNPGVGSASQLITAHIRGLGDWRGEKLALVRKLIHEADPDVIEEWKWDIPVWSHDGIICTGETYKEYVKLTFAKGAFIDDIHKVFNAGFAGNTRRAIDIRRDAEVPAATFRDLIREAVSFNQAHPPKGR